MSPSQEPHPAHAHRLNESRTLTLYALAIASAVTFPGAVVGALAVHASWRLTRPPVATRLLFAVLGILGGAMLRSWLVLAWPLRLILASAVPAWAGPFDDSMLGRSIATEALFGPALLVLLHVAAVYRSRTPIGLDVRRYEAAVTRKKALQPGWNPPGAVADSSASSVEHPPGKIRLGVDKEHNRPFDLDMEEVGQHIFIPGASGTGKTTTLVRLSDGALANGFGVVIVDCKGVGLGGEARRLAERWNVPFALVDPDDDRTLGYDVCAGDPAGVANKIIGAFEFSGEAEIYKQVAMEVVPLIVRALIASDAEVSLESLYHSLGKGGLSQLGRRNGAEPYRDQLEELEGSGGITASGYTGLQRRLGALMQGKFGDVFQLEPVLDWDEATSSPQVTYLSLSSTATGEDVELFGRVITQDLKQLCGRRMRAIDRGENPTPVLIIYDEFAALREATQVVDLLLQARQARAPIVVATQYLPEEVSIRMPVLSAGVIIAHRLGHNDAEQIAKELGTHKAPFNTVQVDYETGMSDKGSVRMVEEFNVHPNAIRTLPVGTATVYSRRTDRRALVHVHRNSG